MSVPSTSEKQDILNWTALRETSLKPRGFEENRVEIWPQLLHARKSWKLPPPEGPSHPDEHQIGLDTDRSFVLYPVDLVQDRETLQTELHELLTAIFRKRPKLSYFQGYHDIITVLFLTLPKNCSYHAQRSLACRESEIQWALLLNLALQNLLRLVDPSYAALLEGHLPLPYFALSNLLTLFSHDMPTLPLIQHVFDYLLCRPPIMSVYLVAAITLARKPEVIRLEEEGEEGMLHSLLSALPDISDEDEEALIKEEEFDEIKAENAKEDVVEVEVEEKVDEKAEVVEAEVEEGVKEEVDEQVKEEVEEQVGEEIKEEVEESVKIQDGSLDAVTEPHQRKESSASSTFPIHTPPTIPSLPSTLTPPSRSPSPAPDRKPQCTFTLTSLLTESDALYTKYPPTEPALCLSSIMGPQSVIFTWSESAQAMPSDDVAECMVEHPNLIVYPLVEEKPELDTNMGNKNRKRRKLHKRIRLRDKKTMVAGAVLVLGVALAVYGIKTGALPDRLTQGGRVSKEWKKIGTWFGGIVIGASERIINLKNDGEL
ncbi:rab-GTPase-TBC domain-containing protein, partial [Mycena floridula]